jgi:elongation factor Ts
MSAVTANDVKTLREMTGVGFMDCKKALTEAGGDLDAAVKLLREKGMAKAAKRAGRATKEGLVLTRSQADKSAASLIQIDCETDFVARNPEFQELAGKLADLALAQKATGVDAFEAVAFEGSTVGEVVKALAGKIGENIKVGGIAYLAAKSSGSVRTYVHHSGKIGVAVLVEFANAATADKDAFGELMGDLAMHTAASAPRFLAAGDVDESTKTSEMEIARQKAKNEGKPENILDRIAEGALKKFHQEYCLLEQPFVKEPKFTVAKLVEAKSKEVGDKMTLAGFRRLAIGEGGSEEPEGEE